MSGRRWGIGDRFIFLISASLLLFMGATYIISREVLRRSAFRTADELAFTILDQTEKRILQFFGDIESLARGLAATQAVRSVSVPDMRDLFLANVRARSRYLRAIYLGTAEGLMFEWGEGRGFVDNAPVFPAGYDPRVRPWYRTALRRDGFSISAPYRYASVDENGITCVLPVQAENGDLMGVLGLDILLENLRGMLEDLQVPKQGRVMILSAGGEVVASQFDEREGRLPYPPPDPASMAQKAGTGSYTGAWGGRDLHFAHKQVPGLDWIIVVGMPVSSIMESTGWLLNAITVIDILLMLLLTVAIASITGKVVLSPLRHMVSVIGRIGNGERSLRVDMADGDEFATLGTEFNRLLDTVEDYSRDLENKVKRRTEDLVRLQRENVRLRVVEERQRILRDLHDRIGAKLTNIFFCTGVAREIARDAPGKVREMLEKTEENCLAAIQSLREIVQGMDTRVGAAKSLSEFVARDIGPGISDGGMVFECSLPDPGSVDAAAGGNTLEIAMILEELASNALKHSNGTTVRLDAGIGEGGRLVIHFSDDGAGLPAGSRWGDGTISGLSNIRHRAEGLSGSLDVDTAPGAGTLFTFTFPPWRNSDAP